MSRIYCSSCGEANLDSGKFCFACGSQLTRGDSVAADADRPTEAFDSSGVLAPGAPKPGELLGHYRIKSLIGRGGFGEVYEARDENLHRSVALKLLPAEVAGDAERLERFRREARAVAGLNHPNIVTLHSIEEASGVPFITMELVEGVLLDRSIPEGGMQPEALLDIAVPLARALAAAHDKGITHRDLKPANVMLDREGRPKILDFGLAKMRPLIDEGSATQSVGEELTGKGVILGTVAYMAPEQVQGREADARADLFSLGVVLYQLATGRRPFTGKSPAEIMSSILRDEPPPVGDSSASMPAGVIGAIERCIRKKPGERFASAGELVEALEEERRRLHTASVATQASPARRPSSMMIGISAIAVVALAALVWIVTQREDGPAAPGGGLTRIVVLPMDNLGPPEDAYFAAGLTDEITSRLSAVAGLGVVSRTTAVQYLDSGKSVREIGEELDVGYLLDGSVRWQHGDEGAGDTGRIRVTSQLIRVSDDTSVWSQSYDEALADVFEVQGSIAGEVVEQLNLTLLAGERSTLESRPTENIEAYRLFLQALEYAQSTDRERDEEKAIETLERAVELDPQFALAWAWLGRTNARAYGSGKDRSDERKAVARDQVEHALALDPDLSEAYSASGFFHYWVNLDYARALEQFEAAIERSPSNERALHGMAYAVRRMGDLPAAVEHLAAALRLNPRDAYQHIEHALTFLWMRDFDRAFELVDRSIELDPDQWFAYVFRGELEWYRSGDAVEAGKWIKGLSPEPGREEYWYVFWQSFYERDFAGAAAFAESMPTDPTTWWYSHPRELYAGLGHRFAGDDARAAAAFDAARRSTERAILRTGDDRVGLGRLHGALGLALAGLGQREDALRHGRQAMDLHSIDEDQIAEGRVWEMAAIAVLVGEHDAAIDALELLLGRPSLMTVPFLEMDPMWDPLRKEDRYAALIAEYAGRDGRASVAR